MSGLSRVACSTFLYAFVKLSLAGAGSDDDFQTNRLFGVCALTQTNTIHN